MVLDAFVTGHPHIGYLRAFCRPRWERRDHPSLAPPAGGALASE
jgi:hypothetical protein